MKRPRNCEGCGFATRLKRFKTRPANGSLDIWLCEVCEDIPGAEHDWRYASLATLTGALLWCTNLILREIRKGRR